MAPAFHFRNELMGDDWETARGFLVEEFDSLYATLQADDQTVGGQLSVGGPIVGASSFVSVPYIAGNFFANGAMTWTVPSGSVGTFGYSLIKKMMTVFFQLLNTTVGGTPSDTLQIRIPGGYVAKRTILNTYYAADNGVAQIAPVYVLAGQNAIQLIKTNFSAWTASAANTQISGQITFEVQ
jgi:hypothetical protein